MFISCIFAIFMGNVFNLCDIWNKTEWLYKHVSLWESFIPLSVSLKGEMWGAMATCTKVVLQISFHAVVDVWTSGYEVLLIFTMCHWLCSAPGFQLQGGQKHRVWSSGKWHQSPWLLKSWQQRSERNCEESKGFRATLLMSAVQMYTQIRAFLVFAGMAMHLPSYPLVRNFFSQLQGSRSCYSVFNAIWIPKTWCFSQQHLLSVISATFNAFNVAEQKEVTECWYQKETDSLIPWQVSGEGDGLTVLRSKQHLRSSDEMLQFIGDCILRALDPLWV